MDINEILEAKAKEIEKMNSQTNQKINDLTAKFDDFQSKTAEKSEIEGIKSELGECKSELLKLSRNNGVQSMTTEMKAEAWSKRVSDILRKNRTEHAEFDSAREKGAIGIPCIVDDEGKLCLSWEQYI